jgi:hypothetical protein
MTQLHAAYADAFVQKKTYSGGMHWKKSKNKEYLFRTRNRRGNGSSLGPRSPETEKVYQDFHNRKKQAADELKHIQEKLKLHARISKAAMIGRVPRLVTAILRLLEQRRLLGKNLKVIGTHALYAYEAAAGVFFESGLTATRDMDLLWDSRPRLHLVAFADLEPAGLMGLLQKADASFRMIGTNNFRSINQTGYMVDLVKAEPKSIHTKDKRQMGDGEDLAAAEIRNLQWLLSSPAFSQTVIGDDGYPATMIAPDPRAFALHKLWLSRQADREPIKKKRDEIQALAVLNLILQYLPGHPFVPEELKMFPKQVVAEAQAIIEKESLPPGYDG